MKFLSPLSRFIASASFLLVSALAVAVPASATVVTETLFFNYFPFTPPGAITTGPANRVEVGFFSYDDADLGVAVAVNEIFAAPGATYVPGAPGASPLNSLVVNVRLLGVGYAGSNQNPLFTHQHDIDYDPDEAISFPSLTFTHVYMSGGGVYVPEFLDYVVLPGGPNGAGALLASVGVGGFATFDDLTPVASFDAEVLLITVPVPAALPLFATGLTLVGFAGWRRKRVAVA